MGEITGLTVQSAIPVLQMEQDEKWMSADTA